MRKKILLTIFASLFTVSSSIAWAETKPCPQCWANLKAVGIQSLTVNPVPGENILKVHMGRIRQALEKAGINEPVSIFLSIGNNNLGSLGSFTPSARDDGEHGDGAANRPIFSSIPVIKNVSVAPALFIVEQQETSATDATLPTLARPARPARPATVIRPARPENLATIARPARPAQPARIRLTARPERPAQPAGQMQTLMNRQGLLTFKNSKGQVMVYLQVAIVGM